MANCDSAVRVARNEADLAMASTASLRTAGTGDSAILSRTYGGRMQWTGLRQQLMPISFAARGRHALCRAERGIMDPCQRMSR